MALDFQVKFCSRENNGTITLKINILVDGVIRRNFEINGTDAADLKAQLRPKMLAAKDAYDNHIILQTIAQTKLDELKTELGIT